MIQRPRFRSLSIILLVGYVSVRHVDLESGSLLTGVLLPILIFVSLVALAMWVVMFLHGHGVRQAGDYDSGCVGSDSGDAGGD